MNSPRNRLRPQPRTPRRALRAGDPVVSEESAEPKKAPAKKAAAKKSTAKKKAAPSDE